MKLYIKKIVAAVVLLYAAVYPVSAFAANTTFQATGVTAEPYILEIQASGAIGVNYSLVDETIVVTAKPDEAKVSVGYDKATLEELCTTGRTSMLVTSDQPGMVSVHVILAFEEVSTHKTKYISGSFDIDFKQPVLDEVIIFVAGQSVISVNGKALTGVAPASIKDNNELIVPLRTFADAIQAEINYNAADGKVILHKDNVTAEYFIGKNHQLVNRQPVLMDIPTTLQANGCAMVPLNALAQAFGYTLTYIHQSDGALIAATLSK